MNYYLSNLLNPIFILTDIFCINRFFEERWNSHFERVIFKGVEENLNVTIVTSFFVWKYYLLVFKTKKEDL